MTLKFYKTEENDWYVDLPNWEGEISDLQMVCGADTMLDILAQGDDIIWLDLQIPSDRRPSIMNDGDRPLKATLTLEAICADEAKYLSDSIPASGAIYQCNMPNISVPVPVWLCDVTKFVFGKFPEFIYIY